jgi:NadR type nicotinamide-nucleotide adenylyltransferase
MEILNKMLKKIVVIGPESTGKSTLCQQLAEHYNTSWVPEYAREFLLTHGTDYSYQDLLEIAKGQIALEDSITKFAEGLVFIDTDMYVMKVWCEFVFNDCHPWIIEQLKKRNYDLYLLCDIDLPWVHDELREYPDMESRQLLHSRYLKLMNEQHTPWIHIRGAYEERLQTAIEAIDSLK